MDFSNTTSNPNGRAISNTSSAAVNTTTRSGVFAFANTLSTSASIARASPARVAASMPEARRCLAVAKFLTGNRTVFIDYKLREPPGGFVIRHQDVGNLNSDRFVADRRR